MPANTLILFANHWGLPREVADKILAGVAYAGDRNAQRTLLEDASNREEIKQFFIDIRKRINVSTATNPLAKQNLMRVELSVPACLEPRFFCAICQSGIWQAAPGGTQEQIKWTTGEFIYHSDMARPTGCFHLSHFGCIYNNVSRVGVAPHKNFCV